MSIPELFLLGVAASFWPLLIVIVIAALRTPQPARLLAAFLAGGLLTTVVIGVVLVNVLERTSIGTEQRSSARPVVDIVAGVLCLAGAAALEWRRRHAGPATATKSNGRDVDRYLRSTALAFGAGIVLNLFPGFVPFVALTDIAAGSYTNAAEVALVLFFYVVMFAFVEVPLVAYGFAPRRTADATARFNLWLDRNGRRLAVGVLAAIGVYLIVRGVIAL
jgi:hypothetical protein